MKNLTPVEKVMRKSAINFALKVGKTQAEAELAGDKKVASIRKMMGQEEEVETFVDLATGEKTRCTRTEMESRFA